ncbi:MAG: hypothetical protein PSN34_01660 [Urechidicola sp.]|nr:hypothetical protein [Urechidicola sp.]
MNSTYDTHLFIEIICNEGATLVGATYEKDIKIEFYLGRNGKTVMISIEDDEISNTIAKNYLDQLGMSELKPLLFS